MPASSFIRMRRCSQDELKALDRFGRTSGSSSEKVYFLDDVFAQPSDLQFSFAKPIAHIFFNIEVWCSLKIPLSMLYHVGAKCTAMMNLVTFTSISRHICRFITELRHATSKWILLTCFASPITYENSSSISCMSPMARNWRFALLADFREFVR